MQKNCSEPSMNRITPLKVLLNSLLTSNMKKFTQNSVESLSFETQVIFNAKNQIIVTEWKLVGLAS